MKLKMFGCILPLTCLALQTTAQSNLSDHILKTTGLKKRLIAVSQFDFDGADTTSRVRINFSYVNGRGSLPDPFNRDPFDYQDIDFDTAYYITSGPYKIRTIKHFRADHKKELMEIQSTDYGYWMSTYEETYSYDPAGHLLSEAHLQRFSDESPWEGQTRHDFSYNAQGLPDTMTAYGWSSMQEWTPFAREINTYNNRGWIVSTTDEMFNIFGAFTNQHYTYMYDGAGHCISSLRMSSVDDSTWTYYSRDTSTYNAAGRITSNATQLYGGYMTWYNSEYAAVRYNDAGYPDFEYRLTYDERGLTADTTYLRFNTYSPDNLLIERNEYDETAGILHNTRFYYEEYNAPDEDDNQFRIFPVPARDILHVQLTRNKSQEGTIAIYDIGGRILQRRKIPATVFYEDTFPLQELPSGTYFIAVYGNTGDKIVQSFTIQR